MKLLKTFEVCVDNYYNDGSPLSETIVALTASKARYQYFLNRDNDYSYAEMFKLIKVKTIGSAKLSDFFTDKEMFDRIAKSRQIEFAYQGMEIDVCGKRGRIVGGNNSSNLDVLFEGNLHADNCHPHYETTYYDNGTVVKDYKKLKAN